MVYLRGSKGDADSIAPSFFALRAGKRRPIEGEVAPAASPSSSTPPPPAAGTGTAEGAAPALAINNAAGLPMGNPFVS